MQVSIGDFEWWETSKGGYLTEVYEGRIVVFEAGDDWGMGFFADARLNEKPVWCRDHYDTAEDAAEDAGRFYEQEVCPLLGITEAMIAFDAVVVRTTQTVEQRGTMWIDRRVGWNREDREVYEETSLIR
jgi:hypothetical protein